MPASLAAARAHLALQLVRRALGEADLDATVLTLDSRTGQRAKAELAMDRVREKFGQEAVEKGLGLSRRKQGTRAEQGEGLHTEKSPTSTYPKR